MGRRHEGARDQPSAGARGSGAGSKSASRGRRGQSKSAAGGAQSKSASRGSRGRSASASSGSASRGGGGRSRAFRTVSWVLAAAVAVAAVVVGARWLANRPVDRASLNVLLISMDTTRADRLGCYGCTDVETPHIDRLAREGALFTQCTTSAPLTLPAHASLLTGVYPFVHGARVNGEFLVHPDNVTLAEMLKAGGLSTAAEIAAVVLDREYGLDQGFDVYRDIRQFNAERRAVGQPTVPERRSESIADESIRFLRDHADRRFFLFAHFFDPHKPRDPPEPFRSRYADPYLGEIAYMDAQIGRILSALDELSLADRTLVVLTADHGEGLGDHGEDSHGVFVYDSTLSMPLIVRCPGHVRAGLRVDAQTSIVDIVPTVLDVLGMDPPALTQGVSLRPLLEGGGPGRAGDAAGVPGTAVAPAVYAETLGSLFDFRYAPLRALRQDGWKYIFGPAPELYHVADDPGETKNLIADEPERARRMRTALLKLVATAPPMVGGGQSRRRVDAETRRTLQSLGYLGGEGDTAAPVGDEPRNDLERYPPTGLNPMAQVDEINLLNDSVGLLLAGRYAEAEAKLRGFLADHPDRSTGLYRVHRCLANVLEAQRKFDEAIKYYIRTLAERGDDGATWTDFGITLRKVGQPDRAIEAFRESLKHPPVMPHTYTSLASALASKGDYAEAEKQFRAALALNPDLPGAYAGLGEVCARTGRRAEAVRMYQRAVDLAPKNTRFRRRLAGLSDPEGAP